MLYVHRNTLPNIAQHCLSLSYIFYTSRYIAIHCQTLPAFHVFPPLVSFLVPLLVLAWLPPPLDRASVSRIVWQSSDGRTQGSRNICISQASRNICVHQASRNICIHAHIGIEWDRLLGTGINEASERENGSLGGKCSFLDNLNFRLKISCGLACAE